MLVDKIQIQQVMLNLVRNALEAMASSPKKILTIGLVSRPGQVEMSVADTGLGVPAMVRDRLFSPFSSSKEAGMGIGLAVCREIVESHGGRIWAETNDEGGTTFRFTIPLIPSEEQIG